MPSEQIKRGDDVRRQNQLRAWLHLFYTARGIDRPTGRPLYAYRATEVEFHELERALKHHLEMGLRLLSLGDYAANVIDFPEVFVFYASDWWRRRYDGSGWSWDPMIRELGADPDGWSQQQRTDCVVRGLRAWGLLPQDRRGLRYLGSVAVNGGLPLKLVAEARGNIGVLLRRVLRLAKDGNSSPVELYGWIESLSALLPQSYRQQEIYLLLAEIITASLKLRDDFDLKGHEGLIDILDRREPAWRDRFPLAMEDEHAGGLIEQLVQEVVALPTGTRTVPVHLWRGIESDGDGRLSLRSEVVLPERMEANTLGTLFGVELNSLPRMPTLRWVCMDGEQDIAVRKLAGHERYRIDLRPLATSAMAAAGEQSLELSGAIGLIGRTVIPRGDALLPDLPWVFGSFSGERKSWDLLRQGSGPVAPRDAFIAIPSNWTVEGQGGAKILPIGGLSELDRVVVEVSGRVDVIDEQGTRYSIRTLQAAAPDEIPEWNGTRVWNLFERPAFRGKPQLFLRTSAGQTKSPQAEKVLWALQGASGAVHPDFGPLEARWPREGATRWRSRVIVLPPQADVQLMPGLSPQEGVVRLTGWGVSSIECLSDAFELSTKHVAGALELSLKTRANCVATEWIDLEARWPNTTVAVPFRVPFPAWGVSARDSVGRQLPDGTSRSVSDLHGLRLWVMFGRDRAAELELSLIDSQPRRIRQRWKLRHSEYGQRLELRPLDYQGPVSELLSSTSDVDAKVDFTISIGNRRAFTMNLTRFEASLSRDDHQGIVCLELSENLDLEKFESIGVNALNLSDADSISARLPAVLSEDVAVGAWRFDPTARSPGPWLIYPAIDSGIKFRPQLWPVPIAPAAEAVDDGLVHSLRIGKTSEREDAIKQSIAALSADFLHPDWPLVERLADHLGHLPLATLDIWRLFAQSGRAMAALAMRMNVGIRPDVINRFAVELPFLWELISFADWRTAMANVCTQAEGWMGVDGRSFAFDHLRKRCEVLGAEARSLEALLDAAYACTTGDVSQNLRFSRNPAAEAIFCDRLYHGDSCHLQSLLRDHADDLEWPVGPTARLDVCRLPPLRALVKDRLFGDYRDAAIIVPVELAARACLKDSDAWNGDLSQVYMLKTFRAFDVEWFTEAYHLTVVRCLSQKILNW